MTLPERAARAWHGDSADDAYEYDRATAVSPVGNGVYEGVLDPGWVIGSALNGGYVMALAGRAIALELTGRGHTDPFSVSAYFLTPSVPGPVTVRVRTVRHGGRRSTVAATVTQQQDGAEVERITLLATYGALADNPPEVLLETPVVALPPVEQCVAMADGGGEAPPLMHRFDIRFDPATAGWALGRPSGEPELRGWFSLADDRPLDAVSMLLVLDAFPPVTFGLGQMGWAPTLELTAHVRAVPVPGPVAVRLTGSNVAGGHFAEDCEVWDSTGRLVAQSRQLALLPRPTHR